MNRVLSVVGSIAERCITISTSTVLVVVMLLVFIDVSMRYLFGETLTWGPQLEVWLVIFTSFLIAGLVAQQGRHISVEIVPAKLLRGTPQRVVRIINSIVLLVFNSFVLCSAVMHVWYLKNTGVTRLLISHLPWWPLYAVIFVLGIIVFEVYSIKIVIDTIKS